MWPDSLTETEKQWRDSFSSRLQSLAPDQDLQTGFLDPVQLQLAEELLKRFAHLGYMAYGGYSFARRACLHVFSSAREGKLPPVTALIIARRRDLAGSDPALVQGEIVGLGIPREQLGDIIELSDDQVAVFTLKPAAPLICRGLNGVGGWVVDCRETDPAELPLPSRNSREITGTVASLRLDAILSLGFGLSRSRAALVAAGGLVKINWRAARSPAARIREGYRIMLAGRGELVVREVTGKTRKGRLGLRLTKFSQ